MKAALSIQILVTRALASACSGFESPQTFFSGPLKVRTCWAEKMIGFQSNAEIQLKGVYSLEQSAELWCRTASEMVEGDQIYIYIIVPFVFQTVWLGTHQQLILGAKCAVHARLKRIGGIIFTALQSTENVLLSLHLY